MASAQNASGPASGKTVRAGLIYQAVGLNAHLKVALSEAGVDVVVEALANALDANAIRASKLDVFVVNLDPELEDHLDELTELLDQMRAPVIFNDGAASSGLGGWDQARWARHLAAKIKGELDSTPPRPADAGFIPVPLAAPKVVARAVPVVPALPALAAAEPAAKAPVVLASTIASPPSPGIDQAPEFSELDFDFDSHQSAQPSAEAAEADGMEGFDASAFDLPDFEATPQQDELADLDSLFSAQPAISDDLPAAAKPAPAVIDALDFSDLNFELAQFDAPGAAIQAPKVTATAAETAPPTNWSLEPLAGELSAPVPTGRAVYVAKDVVVPESIAPVAKSSNTAALVPAPAEDAQLEDFDSFLSSLSKPEPSLPSAGVITKQLPVVPAPIVEPTIAQIDTSEFDALFSDLDDLTPIAMPDESAGPGVQAPSQFTDSAFSDGGLDFDMDFEIGNAADAGSSAPDAFEADDFADLDSLFADAPTAVDPVRVSSKAATPVGAANATGPDRVFVLGASIGGPEAVRTFLGKLKAKTPAAFILAQHMGAEFLELMTSQLAKASAMPVRLAKPGETFAAGEIVVVPVSQRFMVDSASVIQFAPLPTESPYSPSIDQVMIDMADRFGSRCTGIIFSGMASDAIEGAKYLAARGAKVWVQDPATCVISSMIDGAQAAGVVSFVGAPEQLADQVLDDLGTLN